LKQAGAEDWVVNSDDFTGGKLVAKHLLALGHRRIGALVGSPDIVNSQPRIEGFRKALGEAGVEIRPEWFLTAGMNWRLGQAAMEKLLALDEHNRPTAIFAANDLCAEGAIRAVRAAGLSVPDDFGIVGYDDTFYATLTQPPLTTVRMPIQEMGELAVRMLIGRLEGQADIDPQPVLPVSLTVRSSCGALLDPKRLETR
jgi:LacI family transcriptional regulator